MGTAAPRVEGSGPLCPTDDSHGRLTSWSGGEPAYDLYCSAIEHVGFRFFSGAAIERRAAS